MRAGGPDFYGGPNFYGTPATGGEGRHLLFLASYWPMGLHKKLINIPTARPEGVNNPPFFTFWNIYTYYTYIIRFLKRLHCEIIFIRSFYRNSWIFKKNCYTIFENKWYLNCVGTFRSDVSWKRVNRHIFWPIVLLRFVYLDFIYISTFVLRVG